MLFSSTTFLYFFLPIVLIVYYGLLRKSRKLQNIFLTFASLAFYAWGEPRFVLVMLLVIIANWLFALWVNQNINLQKKRAAKVALVCAIAFNLLILFIFKYLTFSARAANEFLSASISVPDIALPIGISFFIFQAMSYVLDVYRGRGECQKNIINVGLYVSLFPQLIAGPIVRYETISHEIVKRKETLNDFFDGFARFVIGLAKKVLIANSLAVFADRAFASVGSLSVASGWLGAVCYTFQIFFDFNGYSDMAIGLGKMFGFHFSENFDSPYISKSVTEFWRRWHISLGSWFRDYVYIPLGGSRVSKSRLILNLFIVWFLTGVWHGANWTFIVWGIMYFVLLTFEKLTGMPERTGKGILGFAGWVYTFFFVIIGMVIFRSNSLSHAAEYIGVMLGLGRHGFIDAAFISSLKGSWILLAAAAVFSTPAASVIKGKIEGRYPVLQAAYRIALFALFAFSLASIASSSHNPFIYFNF